MADTNKTEKATSKKRNDERKKGNVFKSRDVVSVVSLLLGFMIIALMSGHIYSQVKELYLYIMDYAGSADGLTIVQSGAIARRMTVSAAAAAAPVLAVMFLVAVLANALQTKFLLSWDLLKPKFSRMNPISGIKRVFFSLNSVVELLKSIVKIAVVFWLVYGTIMTLLSVAPDLLNTALDAGLLFMRDEIMDMVYIVCLIFTAVAILDYFYQRYDYEKKLRMSKQEVKDEYKQTEGDPMIKGKRREKQREISMSRMMQQIPQADVVVRNPTHFAVALRYDIDKDPAPVVLAKGQDYVALRIISIAEEHEVLMTENPSLARSLYGAVEVGGYIPAELYNAVAEVMAWVYEQQKREIIGAQPVTVTAQG
ncbi:MAG: flagellar biosynthesis protein FlhB [Clostridiales Family XIII bacterium]|jgi:flagellar biosynthetic protein FlhB|nr:flagellar biosynthesis protein FlhB [Clostridiales Family XIII bacterium]